MAKPIGALELRYPMIQFLIKGIIRDTKMASITGVGHLYYGNIKIQSFYGSWEKHGFVKAAVSRAVRLSF